MVKKVPIPKNLDFSYAWKAKKPKETAYVYDRSGFLIGRHIIIKLGRNVGALRDGRRVYKYHRTWYLY